MGRMGRRRAGAEPVGVALLLLLVGLVGVERRLVLLIESSGVSGAG
jgi:hypothetical protein